MQVLLSVWSNSLGFADESALLKHELAYCLGQMKNTKALPVLESVLANEKEDPMVRHEVRKSSSLIREDVRIELCIQAAEALGAISVESSKDVLKRYLNDPERCVRETCEIALAKIEWDHSTEGQQHWETTAKAAELCVAPSPRSHPSSYFAHRGCRAYTSIDPAPPTSGLLAGRPAPEDASDENIARLHAALLDTGLPLFERYRAMFALRNIGTPAAVDALAAGFADDSALFKYVCPLYPCSPRAARAC